jgi:predicted acetyltransferase
LALIQIEEARIPQESVVPGVVALEIPRVDLIDSYRGLVREFEDAGEDLTPFPLSYPHGDGPALVERLARESRGEGLPEGFVAHSTFWLVLDGEAVVGVSNLRHELTPFLRHEGGHIGYGVRPSARGNGFGTEMLRQTFARAAVLGLERVLVACDADNERSIRVIVRNGGALEADNVIAHDGVIMHRYWITVGAK